MKKKRAGRACPILLLGFFLWVLAWGLLGAGMAFLPRRPVEAALPVEPRLVALGGAALVPAPDGLNGPCFTWRCQNLAFLSENAGFSQLDLGVAWPLKRRLQVSLDYRREGYNLRAVSAYVEEITPLETFQTILGVAWGGRAGETKGTWRGEGKIRLLTLEEGGECQRSLTGQMGLAYQLTPDLELAGQLGGIGVEAGGGPLPLEVGLGGRFQPRAALTLHAALVKPAVTGGEGEVEPRLGVEYRLARKLALRGGWRRETIAFGLAVTLGESWRLEYTQVQTPLGAMVFWSGTYQR